MKPTGTESNAAETIQNQKKYINVLEATLVNAIKHIKESINYRDMNIDDFFDELSLEALPEKITDAVASAGSDGAGESTTDTAAESGASDSQDSQKDSDSPKKRESFEQRMERLGGKGKNSAPDKVMTPEQLAKWITQNLIKIGEKGNEDVAELAYDLMEKYCQFHKVDAINELNEEHVPAVQGAFEEGFQKYFLDDAEDKHKFTALDVLVKSLEPTE